MMDGSHYWNFTSSFDYDLQSMCNYPHVTLHPPANWNVGEHRRTYDVISIFQDGGRRVRKLPRGQF